MNLLEVIPIVPAFRGINFQHYDGFVIRWLAGDVCILVITMHLVWGDCSHVFFLINVDKKGIVFCSYKLCYD